ncbi:MAG: 6-bladed beta-propeller [Gemmatimonadota bacterium]
MPADRPLHPLAIPLRASRSGARRHARARFHLLRPLLVAVAAWGCGEGGSAPGDTAFADSAGITIATASGDGWSVEDGWRLEPDLTIGDVSGELSFGRIASVAPAPGGRIYVLDRQSQLVHVFDADGKRLLEFGGEGGGPGEFQRATQLFPVGDDRLAVAEGFPPTLHWLTAEGSFLRTFRLDPESGAESQAATFAAWAVLPSGELFAHVAHFSPQTMENPESLLLRIHEEAPPDTLAPIPQNLFSAMRGEIRMFEPRWVWTIGRDGSYWLSGGMPYEVRGYGPEGALSLVLRRSAPSVVVTDEIEGRVLEQMREQMAAGGAPQAAIDQMLGRVVFEPEVPQVLRLWASEPDEHLWVGVPTADAIKADATGVGAYDVFARDGRFVGRIAAPEGFALHVVTADAVYGVWKDELDVQYARRYRIVRPGKES